MQALDVQLVAYHTRVAAKACQVKRLLYNAQVPLGAKARYSKRSAIDDTIIKIDIVISFIERAF